ncbi:MAG: glycosyl hydrolase family 18 protein [Eubacteriales bacterium]|nr:glycosyl hydrolase family 18 protein [Eubacteriales bacterium]
MSKSRRKKKKSGLLVKIVLFFVFIGLVLSAFGETIFDRWIPSTEEKDLNEWFEVQADEVKLYLNASADHETIGYARDGGVFLPYTYVYENLNSRFFWSDTDEMMSFTLPDKTLDFTASSKINGIPVFEMIGDELYISLDAVESYSNVSDKRFIGDDISAKRVFVYTGGTELLQAGVLKETAVRTQKNIKAPVLTELVKGASVYVTERDDEWSRIITEDGIAGYAGTKAIDKPEIVNIEDTYLEPEVPHTLMDDKVVMGWHYTFSSNGNTNFDEYYANTAGAINVISPTWIQISDAEGNYKNYTTAEYMEKAHAAGLKVWVSVDNFNQEGGLKDFSTKEYFESSENRRDFISRLMADAAEYGYDGINLDFEGLPTDAGEKYIQFIRELSVECRKNGLVLSVDNYVPYGFNNFYNLDEQGVFADYIVVMLYDEHTDDAGSVASIGYTEFGISETLKSVNKERLIAALPLFTRLWSLSDGRTSSETMDMKKADQYVKNKGYELKWDDVTGQNYGEKIQGNVTKKIWMEDKDSLALKMQTVKQYDCGGIALWRLGYEPSEIWNELTFK